MLGDHKTDGKEEKRGRKLASLVETVADCWDIDFDATGSSTFKRADIETGFEADAGFYIRHAEAIREHEDIDLGAGDPPPDLIIEVEGANPTLPKFPVFGQLGVPEVWRVDRKRSAASHLAAPRPCKGA